MNNEFYHHGIQGQKWGKRNGPPYPLGANDHSAAEKKAARNNTHNKLNNRTDQTPVRINRSSNVKSNKNRQTKPYKLTESEKSIARAYRKNVGMSKIDAERMAVYQSRAKKIAIGVAVGALVVGTAYIVVKTTQDPYRDFTILPGTKIQRITPFGDNDVREQFYGAINKKDKSRYIWGIADWKQTTVYQQELVPKKPIKVAGINTCENLFNEMRSSNPEFNKALNKDFEGHSVIPYSAFNRYMVSKEEFGNGNSFQMFQNALKRKGYGALIDHNDAAGRGWGTERPVIFFGQESNLQSSIKELSRKKISEARRDYATIQRGQEIADQGIGFVAAAGGISTLTTGLFTISGMMTNREIIKEYKSLHPNTNLSDSKILNIFDRSD